MPVVELSQNSRLRLVIPVPESAVFRIHVGGPVTLGVQSLHKTFTGTVSRFSNRLDTETRTMHVEVDVENPTLEIVPGMYADVSLVLDEVKGVIVAPVQAVDRTGSPAKVLVITPDHHVELREVTVGLESADRVEIKAGLTAGDLVVVGNVAQLTPGVLVAPKVMAETAEEGAAP
jgi:RND family efflux transporter MFP subunit